MVGFRFGRFGDNHVSPDMLFDPRDPQARPPQDALDVVFRCPSSLNVMLDGMAQAGREDLLDQWRALYAEVGEETCRHVQRSGGYVTDAARGGDAPARLAITGVMHSEAPGFSVARWHLHVYVGTTGTSLLDDRQLPVHFESVRRGVDVVAEPRYAEFLEQLTAERFDVRWDIPRPGALHEIVEPPWHDHIDTLDRGLCPGPEPWGTHPQLVADAENVALAARDVATHDRLVAEGRAYQPITPWSPAPWDEDEDEDEDALSSS